MSLALDGAALDLGGRKFTYEIAKPFGPKRGQAFLEVIAKPAASQNTAFRTALDDIMHRAKVLDLTAQRRLERDGNEDAFVRANTEAQKWVQRAVAELQFDHCIISWATNIQNDGSDLEPTRENFVALAEFEHPEIRNLFSKMRADLGDFDQFSAEADVEVSGETEKN